MGRCHAVLWMMFASLSGSLPARGAEAPFPEDDCEQIDLVAREFLALERSGARWQGGEAFCVPKLKLKTWKAEKIKGLPDPSLADPDYLIPGSRRIDIKSRRTPDDRIVVKYSYVGKKNGREFSVQDELDLKLNFGKARAQKGCAELYKPPRYLVMDLECVRD